VQLRADVRVRRFAGRKTEQIFGEKLELALRTMRMDVPCSTLTRSAPPPIAGDQATRERGNVAKVNLADQRVLRHGRHGAVQRNGSYQTQLRVGSYG
jgi:hypothetical protein